MKKIFCLLIAVFSQNCFAEQQLWLASMTIQSGDEFTLKYLCETNTDADCAGSMSRHADYAINLWSSRDEDDPKRPEGWTKGETPVYLISREH